MGWPRYLIVFIPLAIALKLAGANETVIFFASALGVIPTAALMGRATEELAARSGPGIGGFLNVTFGNAPELIIALFALGKGLHEVVKASLVGSILGNVLLVLGAAMFFGGLGRERQVFNRTAASAQSSMLLLAGAAITMPAVFELVSHGSLPGPHDEIRDFPSKVEHLSLGDRDPADRRLRRRPRVLAEDAPRPLQPPARGGRGGARAVDGAQVGRHARDRRRRRSA